ncbi:MAG: response regulator transcription factor [Flavobacteriales bacterium]|nr:Transcriptional regulatory protein BtsR [Flavobacteriales bacterium]MCC6578004.1 response regulator transcription factor [Flavobacteriales bacterium]NUQ14177.1 response regulator transcription factor [Flavobacteriales bacterium]
MFNEDPNLPCSHAERQQRASNGGDGRKNGRSGATVTFARMGRQRLHALIVDDEEPARENLRLMLEDHCPGVEVVGVADGPATARERIGALDPDLLFLDIRMPSGTEGLDLLAELPDLRALVIFVTAFKDYALQAFHTHAVDYLLKPIDAGELRAAVAKAGPRVRVLQERPAEATAYRQRLGAAVRDAALPAGRIVIDHAKGFKLFDPRTIAHLEAEGNCTRLHFSDGTRYLDTRTLRVYEELLDPAVFLRVHRSHIVNLEHLREYLRDDGHWAVLHDGRRVPIARERVNEFLERVR